MFDSLKIYIGRTVKQFEIKGAIKIKNFLWFYYGIAEKEQKDVQPEVSAQKHCFLQIYIKTCHNNQQMKIKRMKKIENEIKKIGKMSSIFEFSISKLGYMEIFIKIREKNIFNYVTI